MRYPKLRELKEAIKAIVKGPYTTKYPKEPFTPPKVFRGKPVPSQDGCIGCGACVEVCPVSAIKMSDDKENKVRTLEWYYDECIFCGQCERYCTTRKEKVPGVKLNQEFDLSSTDRKTIRSEIIKKNLVLCSNCRAIISTKEHFLWVAKQLEHKSYGNINLLSLVSEKFFSHTQKGNFKQFNQRENMYEIMCPKCRRLTLLFDEYGKI
jgi:hydrogenase-4 component H